MRLRQGLDSVSLSISSFSALLETPIMLWRLTMPEHNADGRRGVPDWDDKLRLFKALLDVQTDKAFLRKVLSGTRMAGQADHMHFNGYPGKWRDSWPTQDDAHFVIDMLAAALPTKEFVTSTLLLKFTIDEYIDRLPDDETI